MLTVQGSFSDFLRKKFEEKSETKRRMRQQYYQCFLIPRLVLVSAHQQNIIHKQPKHPGAELFMQREVKSYLKGSLLE